MYSYCVRIVNHLTAMCHLNWLFGVAVQMLVDDYVRMTSKDCIGNGRDILKYIIPTLDSKYWENPVKLIDSFAEFWTLYP
jgi:hypothetical protein